MNAPAIVSLSSLPSLIDRAAHALTSARSAPASVSGSCKSIIARLAEAGPASILAGCLGPDMRARVLAAVEECRDALTSLLEQADAEEARC